MLLVVSLGLSVVVESLGKTMRKCQLLAGAHFVFGGGCRIHFDCHSLTFLTSLIRRWHCGAGARVYFSFDSSAFRDTPRIHAQRLPSVDHVFIKWFVASAFLALYYF